MTDKRVGVRIDVGVDGKEQVQALTNQLDSLGREATAAGTATTAGAAGTRQLGQAAQGAAADAGKAANAVDGLGDAATTAGTQMVRSHRQVSEGVQSISSQLGNLQKAYAALQSVSALQGMVRDVSQTAEAYTNLAARIRLVTGEGEAFDTAFKGVFEVATRTNSAVEATGQLFAKLAQAGKALGVSQAEALSLTETINQAIQIGGASAAGSEAAITQLVQGLQSGVLRGDEFNSVMEQAPRLAQALADGLGTTTGELRKMAEAGQLSADVVVQALRGQGAAVQSEFSQLPKTVGRALQNLSTEWTRYVGEVDKANGISSAAATAIGALAANLDTLGTLLATAGKAAAAYAALRLGAYFRDKAAAVAVSAAALGSETAALATNTAATSTNTAAKTANALATRAAAASTAAAAAASTAASTAIAGTGAAAAAASVGGLAALRAAGLRVLGLLGPIGAAVAGVSLAWDGIKGVGTWLGETAAKLMGARDRTEELEAATRASAKAAQQEAAARAAQAQQTALAADKALGLSTAARALVGDFDQLRTKGTGAAEALAKLAKDMDLGTPQGIYDAVAALDALERKGKVTGPAVREALRQALDGQDLGKFEVRARAAFDGSEQGARRLALALDGMRTESLNRVGTSLQELQTGFTAAFNSAANTTDVLAQTLKGMGVEAERAGPLLAKSLDKEIEAANTEKALRHVQERLLAMGESGTISGDQVAAGLEKVRKKSDEILPGINSVGEAARLLGVKTAAELQRTAADFKKAWELVSQSTEVSLRDKVTAFARYRDAAIAANGGVESSEIALQRQTLQTKAEVAGLGGEFERAMGNADKALGRTKKLVNELGEEVNAAGERINQMAAGFKDRAKEGADAAQADKRAADEKAQRGGIVGSYDVGALNSLLQKEKTGGLSAGDLGTVNAGLSAARFNLGSLQAVKNQASVSPAAYSGIQREIRELERLKRLLGGDQAGGPGQAAIGTTANPAAGPSVAAGQPVNVYLRGSQLGTVRVASAADAAQLQALLQRLEADQQRAGP